MIEVYSPAKISQNAHLVFDKVNVPQSLNYFEDKLHFFVLV